MGKECELCFYNSFGECTRENDKGEIGVCWMESSEG